jgi:hypothetical protein
VAAVSGTVPYENIDRKITAALAYLREHFPAVAHAIELSPRRRATDYALALDLAILVATLRNRP